MAFFGVGSTALLGRARQPRPGTPAASTRPPRSPCRVRRSGSSVRVPLGETGAEIFPLILGGAEFGWNVDLESSHEILDALRRAAAATPCTPPTASPAVAASTSSGSGCTRAASATTSCSRVRVGGHPDNPGLGPVNLVRAVEASLTRLRHRPHRRALPRRDDRLDDRARRHPRHGRVARRVGQGARARRRRLHRRAARRGPHLRLGRLSRASPCSTCRSTCCAATSSTPTCGWSPARRAWRSRRRTRSSTASSPGGTAPARAAALSVRGAQIAANINRRGSRTLRALDAVGTELGVPDAAVAVAWLLAQKLVTAPIVNAYAAAARRGARAGRRRAAQPQRSWPTSPAPPSRRRRPRRGRAVHAVT